MLSSHGGYLGLSSRHKATRIHLIAELISRIFRRLGTGIGQHRDARATKIGNNRPNGSLESGGSICPEETIHATADLDIEVKRGRHHSLEGSTKAVKIHTILVEVRVIDTIDG